MDWQFSLHLTRRRMTILWNSFSLAKGRVGSIPSGSCDSGSWGSCQVHYPQLNNDGLEERKTLGSWLGLLRCWAGLREELRNSIRFYPNLIYCSLNPKIIIALFVIYYSPQPLMRIWFQDPYSNDNTLIEHIMTLVCTVSVLTVPCLTFSFKRELTLQYNGREKRIDEWKGNTPSWFSAQTVPENKFIKKKNMY